MTRLSLAALPHLPDTVARPAYDVAAARIGIVHLGLGAFHRAHQALYVEDRLNAGEEGWAICGVSLRSPDTRDALAPQDGLYTLIERSGEGTRARVVGALRRLLVAPEDPQAVIAAMADPAVRIVSLTITEKGYCHDPATGRLRADHPDIVHDLARPQNPKSAPGFLAAALARRRAAGVAPFTVLCCDNLPSNGRTVRQVVIDYAQRLDPALAEHVAADVAFPSTMVDRIVPATTDADREDSRRLTGFDDAWPVSTEPFTQWVIEDAFGGARPHFEAAGATTTRDVAGYEAMKLRLLNGSHSTMAYLGYLAGHETIADAIADPVFAALVRGQMVEEMEPTLAVPAGADVRAYEAQLLERFANPALRHRTWQIAMDGSQKIPQRWLGPIRAHLAAGRPFPRLALALAGWIAYASGRDERGGEIDVRDPLAARFAEIAARAGGDVAARVEGFLAVREVFGEDLGTDERFVAALVAAARLVAKHGARGAASTLVETRGDLGAPRG